uniref:Serrate RNA effector molecule homolog n=1 Tax=Ciona intestinalis TaxID=7719 RepID=F7BHR3_CIOIN
MGDSGDEYSRQPRDKFQRERSDQFERRGREREYPTRSRGWNAPMSGGEMKGNGMRPMGGEAMPRHRPPDYPMGGPPDMKRRFSPGRESESPFEPGFEGGWGGGWNRQPFHPRDEWGQGDRGSGHPMDMQPTGPKMLTFKQWLNNQKDDITDEEAVKNYTEYKINFRRQQLQEFFIAHKDEEWFKEKYEPDEADKRFSDQRSSILWRADVYSKLIKMDTFDLVDIDLANEEHIIKVLDSAVILMEGGNDEDLKILDEDPASLNVDDPPQTLASDAKSEDAKEDKEEKKETIMQPDSLTEEQYEMKKQAELFKQLVKKTESESEPEIVGCMRNLPSTGDGEGLEQHETTLEDEQKNQSSENERKSDTEGFYNVCYNEADNVEKPTEDGELKQPPKARALHQTHSIFMRNLPPSVSKLDIINLCKRFAGFIRVAFSHPLEDRNRFYRRCWVTFDRNVNIKDICWNLNNLRLRDLELNPVVNRDLSRRVRPISGIAQHVQCARNDLRNVARLIMHLDGKWKLWEDNKEVKDEDKKTDEKDEPGNPWLKNISEYLVDEMDAEEEELVGDTGKKEEGEDREGAAPIVKITRDEKLIKVLDRLLYYLRIVHSVDYYNASEYPCEDEMPNRHRCGIMHARGPIPPNLLTKSDINEFQKRFNDKLAHILNFKEQLTDEEAKKLGPKDEETEVEKFITANTEELGKDKWLCPLSGKKFKGPDYIRKHIFNKHGDKVEAVKKEVKYFNNYLMDPRRPGPMEGQAGKPPSHPGGPPQQGMGYNGPPPRGYGPPPPSTPPFRGEPATSIRFITGRGQYSTPQYHQRPPNPYGNGAGRTYPPKAARMGDPYASRPIVGYQDLDAPEDTDLF